MNTKTTIIIVLAGVAIVGLFFATRNPNQRQSQEKTAPLATNQNVDEVISKAGIHWHPELKIIIKGEEIAIPANIGIGMQYAGHPLNDPMMMMTNMHTHDGSGTIHWEVMQGPVKKDDVRLANFFSVWAKKFDNSCIFENCNGTEGRVVMLVNGKENTEFQNYIVKDKDKIEIRYE